MLLRGSNKFIPNCCRNHYIFHGGGRYHIETSPLRSKSLDWFLYDNDLRHESVKSYYNLKNLNKVLILFKFLEQLFRKNIH